MKVAHPFIKWAGGKKQLLPEIHASLPDMTEIDRYIEPFAGGGAVLFSLLNRYQFRDVYISDTNEQLITLYQTIKDKPEELIAELTELQSNYLPSQDRKSVFLSMREEYNHLIFSKDDAIRQSALFVALNRTCFNGLYRVNSKGEFNVPHGRYANPCICDADTITADSEALKNVKSIKVADFRKSLRYVTEKTLVYCDPPYRPLTVSASFTSYTKAEFDDDCQKNLAKYAGEVSNKGGKILLSNSDPHNTNPKDNFFDEIYDGFRIQRISANRAINSNGEKRGKITELLISNY